MVTATRRPVRPPMTAEQATSFDGVSVGNAVLAVTQLTGSGTCKGGCEPYRDIFTYNRWAAQGMQVQKGQHGAHIPVIVHPEERRDAQHTKEPDEHEQRRPVTIKRTVVVFCRCQVAAR